jgi:multimeric flavodoxin WrbA
MSMPPSRKILALIGSYRKGGHVDSAVSAVLAGAEAAGASTEKIYLADRPIEFCTNCRTCMQAPGPERGRCVLHDDLESILQAIEMADAYVIGAPVNFYNVNALTRRFMERCVGFAYWPWGRGAPRIRKAHLQKRCVLVSSSGAPTWMARWFTGTYTALKALARLFGARPVGCLWIGLVNREEVALSDTHIRRAAALGRKLAA